MKKFYSFVVLFLLTACNSVPTSEASPIISATTPATQTIMPTVTIEPTSLSFCDPSEANKAIKQLSEIGGISESGIATPVPTVMTTTTTDNQKITEEQRLLIVSGIKEQQLKLSFIFVPKCLLPAKGHLQNSLDGMMKLYNPSKDVTNDEIMNSIFYIGTEQQAFEDEINKIQACLPVGCPSPSE